MDSERLNESRQILRRTIMEYASHKPSNGQIDTEIVIDPELDHYEVLHIGWDGARVHGSVIHLDIIGEKIWIQHDGTNRPVANALLDAGVPKDAIILGFYPAEEWPDTGFGVA